MNKSVIVGFVAAFIQGRIQPKYNVWKLLLLAVLQLFMPTFEKFVN
jgi:hypothetical protein